MFVCAQAMVGVAQLTSHDFLAAYRDLTPGNSLDDVQDLPCQLRTGMSSGVEVGMCQFQASDAVFGRVTLVTADHIVRRLAFAVEPEALHIGDLVLCWGQPNQIGALPEASQGNQTTTRWQDLIFAGHPALRQGTQVNYFMPITYLSLESAMLPCLDP
jgi:hypothetical protein